MQSQNIVPLDKHVVSVADDGICFEMEFVPDSNLLEKVCKRVILTGNQTPQGSISMTSGAKSNFSNGLNTEMFKPVIISSRQSEKI